MRILFVHKRVLIPSDTGGKIRSINLLRHLAQWHEVTCLCSLVEDTERSGVRAMQQMGLRVEAMAARMSRPGSVSYGLDVMRNAGSLVPFTIARNFDRRLRARAGELIRSDGFDLVISDTVQMARHVLPLGDMPGVLFQHNVEAQILDRQATSSGHGPRGAYLRWQAMKMRRFEAWAGRQFDAVIAVSAADRELFNRLYGWDHVQAIDTAVDLEHCRLSDPADETPGRIVFVGSMDWMPNQEAVGFFVREVWPLVRGRCPEAEFHIVGRRPSQAVRDLQSAPGVTVWGTVPDVRPHLDEAAVVVVPLLVGGGTRLKIFEAMAMGKAIVSTTIGAEGLPVRHGRHLLLADEPGALAQSIVQLLQDSRRRRALGSAAAELVRGCYGTEPIARQFERHCLNIVKARAGLLVPVPQLSCR